MNVLPCFFSSFWMNFGEVQRVQLAKSTLGTSTLVSLEYLMMTLKFHCRVALGFLIKIITINTQNCPR